MADSDLTFAGLGYDLSTPQAIAADNSFTTARAWNSVPVDAIGSMTPVVPNVADAGAGEWGGYFRDLTKAVVGYAIVKDAQRSGVQPEANAPASAAAKAKATPAGNVMPLLLIGAAIFAVVKLAE